jgi:hypothetical protein
MYAAMSSHNDSVEIIPFLQLSAIVSMLMNRVWLSMALDYSRNIDRKHFHSIEDGIEEEEKKL